MDYQIQDLKNKNLELLDKLFDTINYIKNNFPNERPHDNIKKEILNDYNYGKEARI